MIHHNPPVTTAITPASTPIRVKNGAAVPASMPRIARTRKNKAARDNRTGFTVFSVMRIILPSRRGHMGFDAVELRNFATTLGNIPKTTGPLVKAAVKKTAKDIEGTAKTLAPVDTGNLRSSVTTSDLRNVSQDSPSAEVRASANYAVYVEMGTSNPAYPRQPFMGPAADKHAPAFERALSQIIDKAIGG